MKKYLLIGAMILGITAFAVPSVFAEEIDSVVSTEIVEENTADELIENPEINESIESLSSVTLPVITVLDFNNAVLDDLGGDTTVTAGFDFGLSTSYEIGHPSVTTPSTGPFGFGVLNPLCGTYHSRAFATNSAGTVYGPDMTFFDHACESPTVHTRVSYPQFSSAYIEGDVNNGVDDDGGPFSVGFEYGLTDNYGTTINSFYSVGAGLFSQLISDLTCNTEYHFRAIATNREGGVGYGADATFTTWPCEDSVVTIEATEISQTKATLHGKLNHSLLTQDGIDTGFIMGIQNFVVNTDSSMGEYSYTAEGLVCGTEYSFNAYATDSLDTINGSTLTFTTLPCSTGGGGAGHGGVPFCNLIGNENHPNCVLGKKDDKLVLADVKTEQDKIIPIEDIKQVENIEPLPEITNSTPIKNVVSGGAKVTSTDLEIEKVEENVLGASVLASNPKITESIWFWIILLIVIIAGIYAGYRKSKNKNK